MVVKAGERSKKAQGQEGVFDGKLAGKRETQAMQLLHSMFVKSLAKSSDLKAFEARQKVLGRKEMLAGAQEVLERCQNAPEEAEDEEDEEDADEGQR